MLVVPKNYSRLNSNLNSQSVQKLVRQVESRFNALNVQDKMQKNRILGVGTDGKYIIFVKYSQKRFVVTEPLRVTEVQLQRLLRSVVSIGSHGVSYTATNLAHYFGSESMCAKTSINLLFKTIYKSNSGKVATFFEQWQILFREVCGFSLDEPKILELGQQFGIQQKSPAHLLFALHTYYAIFMKLLSAEIVTSLTPFGTSTIQQLNNSASSNKTLEILKHLENGGVWTQIGIRNFLEGDIFSWYLDCWDDNCNEVLRNLITTFGEFDTETLGIDPDESRDVLKTLYHQLFPRSVRHDLGEYYTPDWLAELLLDELGYTGDPDKKILDPACGSGTFLIAAVRRIRHWFDENRFTCGYGNRELIKKILENVIGFDLNPLAVMASRTNFLIAIRDLIRYSDIIELPVHLCDSILVPSEYGQVTQTEALPTSVGMLEIPNEILTSRQTLNNYSAALESCVEQDYPLNDFLAHCNNEGIPIKDAELHEQLYLKLVQLNKEGRNGVWARIIKNAFAPLFVGKVDFIAGNPPWVNWDNLPVNYRDSIKPIWRKYNLFNLRDGQQRLGGAKKDLSMLFTYCCIDHYLKVRGKLGFVITTSVFKSKQAGSGFRRFSYFEGKKLIHLVPTIVHDFSRMSVFEGAINQTSAFVCRKAASSFSYPVKYVLWDDKPRKIPQDFTLNEVRTNIKRRTIVAEPTDKLDKSSTWFTVSNEVRPGLRKIRGNSSYTFYIGPNSGGLNGAFWINILDQKSNGNLIVKNLYDEGKIAVHQWVTEIEPDLVYPLIRGRTIRKWRSEAPNYIIISQDPSSRCGIPEEIMRVNLPKTYAYFKNFEGSRSSRERGTLRGRAAYLKHFSQSDPFYTMFNVGSYTMSPYKVVCRRFVDVLSMVTVGPREVKYLGKKSPLPSDISSLCSVSTMREGYFLSALGNSAPATLLHKSSFTGKSYGSPNSLGSIGFPRYDSSNSYHIDLVKLSRHCHSIKEGDDVSGYELEIDEIAARIWGITKSELYSIRKELFRGDS